MIPGALRDPRYQGGRVHHGHSVAVDVTIIAAAVVVCLIVMGIAVSVGLRMRRRVFSGLAMDEWERARQRLSWADQWHVGWATMRRRPVDRVELALAQLARARFAQEAAERWLTRRRRLWIVPMIIYAVEGAWWIIMGVLESNARIFHLVLGALFAALALLWLFAVPRSVARQPARMRELRAEIVRRHGRMPGTT
jgi:hypothetical protein